MQSLKTVKIRAGHYAGAESAWLLNVTFIQGYPLSPRGHRECGWNTKPTAVCFRRAIRSALRYTAGLATDSDKSVPSDLAGRKCATRTDVRCAQ